MSISIMKEFTFDAAHYLPNHDGKCRNMHGHTYHVQIEVGALPKFSSLDSYGMVMDFGDLKNIISKIKETLDHKLLNEIFINNPTAENIMIFIKNFSQDLLPRHIEVKSVKVWETPTSCAIWKKDME